jgi:hypothetical protein
VGFVFQEFAVFDVTRKGGADENSEGEGQQAQHDWLAHFETPFPSAVKNPFRGKSCSFHARQGASHRKRLLFKWLFNIKLADRAASRAPSVTISVSFSAPCANADPASCRAGPILG